MAAIKKKTSGTPTNGSSDRRGKNRDSISHQPMMDGSDNKLNEELEEEEEKQDEPSLVPSFQLPPDFHSDRYELWTVRLPPNVHVNDLDGKKLSLNAATATSGAVTRLQGTAVTDEGDGLLDLMFQTGHAAENQSLRLLLKKQIHEEDDNDDDDDLLHPCSKPFTRHFTVAHSLPSSVSCETDQAPRLENAPEPAKDLSVRRAYAYVPQRNGLKRRWIPIGGATTIQPRKAAPGQLISGDGTLADAASKKKRFKPEPVDDDVTERPIREDAERAKHADERPHHAKPKLDVSDRTDGEKKAAKRARKSAKKAKKKQKEKKKN